MLLVGFLCYFEIITSFFLSDDFKFISSITQGKDSISFTQDGLVFRPISIVLVQVIHTFFGLNPTAYHLYHLIVHCLISFFLFLACQEAFRNRLGISEQKRRNWALLSGFGFLIYPFHSEAVVWIACRGTITATLFAAIAYFFYWKGKESFRYYVFSLIAFFIGLLSYESTWAFPLIIILHEVGKLGNQKGYTINKAVKVISWYVGTFLLYFAIRSVNMMSMEGSMGKYDLLNPLDLFLNFGRFIGRMLFPPQESTIVMLCFVGLIFTVLIIAFILTIYRSKTDRIVLLTFAGSIILGILPVLHLGIDTHDSEGGRYLYFPSMFLMITISLILILLFDHQIKLLIATSLLGGIFLIVLKKSNQDWRNAGIISEQTVTRIQEAKGCSTIYVWNLPEQLNGAYIFRQPFIYTQQLYFPDLPEVKVLSKYPIKTVGEIYEIKKMNNGLKRWGDSKNNVFVFRKSDSLQIQNSSDYLVNMVNEHIEAKGACFFYFSKGELKEWEEFKD